MLKLLPIDLTALSSATTANCLITQVSAVFSVLSALNVREGTILSNVLIKIEAELNVPIENKITLPTFALALRIPKFIKAAELPHLDPLIQLLCLNLKIKMFPSQML